MILVGSLILAIVHALSYLRVREWIDLFYDIIFLSIIIKYTKQKHYSTCTP